MPMTRRINTPVVVRGVGHGGLGTFRPVLNQTISAIGCATAAMVALGDKTSEPVRGKETFPCGSVSGTSRRQHQARGGSSIRHEEEARAREPFSSYAL